MDPTEVLQDTMDSLDELKEVLDPLLAAPLSETLSKLSTLEKAKLQTSIAYVIQDLIFMYLKTQGIQPTSHPVISELARIQGYMKKIKEAENPSKRQLALDKEAAGRFIAAALAGNDRMNVDQSEDGPSSLLHDPSPKTLVSDTRSLPVATSSGNQGNDDKVASRPDKQEDHPGGKRRRLPMDPFAGYGDNETVKKSKTTSN
ncbi:hypothetical protein FRC03_011694 [Tulasnella sp. 419]|nr:hypothetical protein FRC03_011694 [Tulasnella sp. 419]